MFVRTITFASLLFWAVLIAFTCPGHAQTESDGKVLVQWDANSEPDLDSYFVYYGKGSGNYSASLQVVAPQTSLTVTGLDRDATYFFAVTATDTAGNESAFSNEVSLYIPVKAPPPDTQAPAVPQNVRGEVVE